MFKFDILCQKWPFLTKMVTFDQKRQIWPLLRHSTYIRHFIFLFLLFETNVLSYLPPFCHNFENLTLYGVFQIFRPTVRGVQFIEITFFFFFHYGSRSIFEQMCKMIRRKKGQEKHPNIYIYIYDPFGARTSYSIFGILR